MSKRTKASTLAVLDSRKGSSPKPTPLEAIMVVKIRLARFGKRNWPFYNIVVAHARYILPCYDSPTRPNNRPANAFNSTARNSKPLEVLGTYDPVPKADPYGDPKQLHKDIKLDVSRAKYWIGVGAQPTDTMWRILSMAGVLPDKKFEPSKKETQPPVETEQVRIR